MTFAEDYVQRGLAVFPVRPRTKAPLTAHGHLDATMDAAVLGRWWRQWPDAGVGIACKPSSLVVLDVDPRNGGDDSLADLERQHGPLPATWRALTGGGGIHVIFQAPADVALVDGALAPGIDLKANGYIVAPPSLHPSGRYYVWECGCEPGSLPLAAPPAWLFEQGRERADDRLRADGTPLVLREGERNRRLFQIGAALRRYGFNQDALRGCLEVANREHAAPPLDAGELRRIAASASHYPPGHPVERMLAVSSPLENDHDIATPGATAEVDQEITAQPIPPFPEAAWRGPFAAYREAMDGTTEMPDAFHFASLWVLAAGTLRRRLQLHYAYPHYPNVYLVNVGATGDTKNTTGMRQGMQLVPSSTMKVLRGIGSAEALADWMTQPDETNAVAHLLVLEELATLLRRGKWEGSTVLHFLTETFDAPPVYEVPFRKNPIKVVEPTPSLLAGTTSEWFWNAMAEVDFHGGFGNRLFFFAGVPKAPISMPAKPAAPPLDHVRAALAALASGPTGDVELASDARPLWDEFYGAWKRTKFLSLVSAATRRIPTYALKLGLVYAAFEHTVPWITRDQLEAAVRVAAYGAACATWLVEQRQTFRLEHRCETAVLEALERVDLPAWRIHQAIGGRFTAEELNRAVRALMGTGSILEIKRTPRGGAVYGRRGRHREA